MEEHFQGSQKPGLMTSSDEYFFQKSTCHSNVTIATKADHPPQGRAPLRKNSVIQPRQLSPNSHCPLQEEKADCQEGAKEVVERHTNVSFAFPSGPELYLHSAPWNPFPSSLQPPALETFYVTKSRDALTETALEIPACREARVPSPPAREAWGFGHHQVLQNAYLKNNLSVPLQNQNSKIASSQWVTAERLVDLNTKGVIRELGKCSGNIKEESHNSVYFFVAQNRPFLPSASTKVCEFENQVGISNIKHDVEALEGEEATSSDSLGSGKPFFLICESEAGGEEEQGQSAGIRPTQAYDVKRQFLSGARSDFICKTISLGLQKDMPGETAVSLESRSERHRVSSPVIVAEDENPVWEGKNETGLLGEAPHPQRAEKSVSVPPPPRWSSHCKELTRAGFPNRAGPAGPPRLNQRQFGCAEMQNYLPGRYQLK